MGGPRGAARAVDRRPAARRVSEVGSRAKAHVAHRTTAVTALLGAVAIAAACASPGFPAGGPPRSIPPRLVAVAPDTLAVGARPRAVEFTFDEVVNEASRGTGAAAGTGGGANGLESVVLVSPRNGSVAVDWGRERIFVRPRRGFRPNVTYTVTILPGLSDLRNHPRDSATIAVFTTGGPVARNELRGVVFDWVNGRTAPAAVVEAVGTDSVPYVALADSVGRFVIPNIPAGAYLVRAGVDVNGNRAIDPREPFDTARATATVRVGPPVFTPPIAADVLEAELEAGRDTTRPRPRRTPTPARRGGVGVGDTTITGIALYAFLHDTLTPRVGTVTPIDSVTLRLSFDRPLRPDQAFTAAKLRIVGPDSATIPVRDVLTAAAADSINAATTAAAAVARARADSVTRANAPAAAGAAGTTPTGAGVARSTTPVPDSSAIRRLPGASGPRLQRPVPPVDLIVRLGARLLPNTIYRLTVREVRSLSGVAGVTERTFTTPRPTPPTRATTPTRAAPVRPGAAPVGPPPAGTPPAGTPPAGTPPAAAGGPPTRAP